MDYTQLAERSFRGDIGVTQALIALQRIGFAMRLYPNGRKGPLDEGFLPLLWGRSPEGVIRIERGRVTPIWIAAKDVAPMIRQHFHLCQFMWLDYDDQEDPAAMSDRFTTPGLSYDTCLSDGGIMISFHTRELDIDYGYTHGMRIVGDWCALIEKSAEPYEIYGFDDEDEFIGAMDFAIGEPG